MLADGGFACALAFGIARFSVGIGPDGTDVNQRLGTGCSGGLGDIGCALSIDGFDRTAQHGNEVHDRISTVDGQLDAVWTSDVGRCELQLPHLAQRLEEIGLFRVALGDADPGPCLQQIFANIAADETAAAEDGDEGRGAFCHAPPLAPGLAR